VFLAFPLLSPSLWVLNFGETIKIGVRVLVKCCCSATIIVHQLSSRLVWRKIVTFGLLNTSLFKISLA
jgi:hypothetical protein